MLCFAFFFCSFVRFLGQVDYSSPGLKVATVLDDPMVLASELHVYASHTKHITIQGRGFVSAYNTHYLPKVRARIVFVFVLSPCTRGRRLAMLSLLSEYFHFIRS